MKKNIFFDFFVGAAKKYSQLHLQAQCYKKFRVVIYEQQSSLMFVGTVRSLLKSLTGVLIGVGSGLFRKHLTKKQFTYVLSNLEGLSLAGLTSLV